MTDRARSVIDWHVPQSLSHQIYRAALYCCCRVRVDVEKCQRPNGDISSNAHLNRGSSYPLIYSAVQIPPTTQVRNKAHESGPYNDSKMIPARHRANHLFVKSLYYIFRRGTGASFRQSVEYVSTVILLSSSYPYLS